MKILLVQTGFLGDVVLSTPVIPNLKNYYPDSAITFLTTPAAAPLVRFNPLLDDVVVFDKRGVDSGISGLCRLANKLRSFDLAFSLHKSYRSAALLWMAKIPVRYGFSEASASFLYSQTVRRKDLGHEVLRNLAILRNLKLEPEDLKQDLMVAIPEDVLLAARSILDEANFSCDKLIAIAPGSVWPTKRWTTQGFSETAGELIRLGYQVVLLGGDSDKEAGDAIVSSCRAPVLNLIGKIDLLTSAAVIASSRLLISNDSAPLHLASAAKTPVVALFCATVPEFGFGPWQVPSRVIGVSGLECRPCGSHGAKSCPTGTEACSRMISSNQVIEAVLDLLEEVKGKVYQIQ